MTPFVAVGALEEAPPIDEASLRGQDAVVRRISEQVEAVLPVRFGTMVKDEAELWNALAPRARELWEALLRVRGKEQMTVRVFGEALPPPGGGDEPTETRGGAGAGTRYLAGRLRAWKEPPALSRVEPLRAALSPLIEGERIQGHPPGGLLLTMHHLVRRGDGPAYRAAVEGAAVEGAAVERAAGSDAGLRFVTWGPSPPYAFAPELP